MAATVSGWSAPASRLTQRADELTSTTWSLVTARPAWLTTLRTPETARTLPVTSAVISFILWREVPGVVCRSTIRSRS